MGRLQKTFEGGEAQGDTGAVAHRMPDLVTVPLEDRPVLDIRTTQVWHRSHVERALAATLDAAQLPVVDVPVPRAGEQTLIIRRPVRRKPIDWHTPIGLAGVLAVMLGAADWSERHPVLPSADASAGAAHPVAPGADAPPTGMAVEAPVRPEADPGTSRRSPAIAPNLAGRAERRAFQASALARNVPARPAAKTRARWNGRGGAPGARGGRIPPAPARTDEDAVSSGTGSAMAHSTTRTRASGNLSGGLPSSTWVDPFASY